MDNLTTQSKSIHTHVLNGGGMSIKSWYSAQCTFLHADKGHGPKQMYEERIVVLRADSLESAIELAEKEAEEYCHDLDGCRYIGHVEVFAMYDESYHCKVIQPGQLWK